jgi:hypothetical protein
MNRKDKIGHQIFFRYRQHSQHRFGYKYYIFQVSGQVNHIFYQCQNISGIDLDSDYFAVHSHPPLHSFLCNGAQKIVHSTMFENRNTNDIKQLIPGMLVAIVYPIRFDCHCSHKQDPYSKILKMPIQIKYIDGGVGVEFIGSGVVTGADIIAANKEIYRNENFSKQRYKIVDRTNCKKYQASKEEIKIIAEQDKVAAKTNPNIIIAFISTSPLQYGISRMYQAYAGENGYLSEIFRDRKSAEKWIEEQLKKSITGDHQEQNNR